MGTLTTTTEATPDTSTITGEDTVLCLHCGEALVSNLDGVKGRWGHGRTEDTTCHPLPVNPVLEALSAHEAAYASITKATGLDGLVVRPDMGLVIAYASTGTYMVELRGAADGRIAIRVNTEWYASADAIPSSNRMARTLARAWEECAPLFAEALATKAAYDAAYRAKREEEARREEAEALVIVDQRNAGVDGTDAEILAHVANVLCMPGEHVQGGFPVHDNGSALSAAYLTVVKAARA